MSPFRARTLWTVRQWMGPPPRARGRTVRSEIPRTRQRSPVLTFPSRYCLTACSRNRTSSSTIGHRRRGGHMYHQLKRSDVSPPHTYSSSSNHNSFPSGSANIAFVPHDSFVIGIVILTPFFLSDATSFSMSFTVNMKPVFPFSGFASRSEERRVGKERRSRGSPYH